MKKYLYLFLIPTIFFSACGNNNETAQKDDLIMVEAPYINEIIKSPLTIKGEARGPWFFEGSFPIFLKDAHGNQLAVGIAQADGEWMTEAFVPFEAILEFDTPATATGILTLEKDNPSGLPEHDDELSFPIAF